MRLGGMFALLTGLVGVVLGVAVTAGPGAAAETGTVGSATAGSATAGTASAGSASAVAWARAAAVPAPAKRWFAIPRAANGCLLNVRIGPSTSFAAAARFTRCDRSASCWFQEPSCGAGTPDQVAAGWYGCRDQHGAISRSNLWTVVIGPDGRPAYTASGCAWTVIR